MQTLKQALDKVVNAQIENILRTAQKNREKTVATQMVAAQTLRPGDIIVEFGEGKRIDRRTYVRKVVNGECMHHTHVNEAMCYDAHYPVFIVKR